MEATLLRQDGAELDMPETDEEKCQVTISLNVTADVARALLTGGKVVLEIDMTQKEE